MASVFSLRNLLFWWVFVTSFVFIRTPTTEFAKNLKNNQIFAQNVFPFSLAGDVTRWLDDRAAQLVKAFQFDPNAIIIKSGNTLILDGYRVGILLIIIFGIWAVRYYTRAVASPYFHDDLIALTICFFDFHLVAQTLKIIRATPIGANAAPGVTLGDQMLAERSTWVWFLVLIILGIALGGRGWIEAKVFWRGVIELFLVWLFFIPEAASHGFASLLEGLVGFSTFIVEPKNMLWTIVWAAFGLLGALNRLYAASSGTGGGGGGGAKGGGGGGGSPPLKPLGGLLGSLRGRSKGA